MPKRLNAIDETIGQLIRTRRIEKGLSQSELGGKIGVSFQQVQKYERGGNRVSGSRLIQIAKVLDVDPAYLLGEQGKHAGNGSTELAKLVSRNDTMRLLRAFHRVVGKQRLAVIQFAEVLAKEDRT